jgi:hypothetical protein
MFKLFHPALAQLNGLEALRAAPHEPAPDAGPIAIHLATNADAPGLVRLAQLGSSPAAAAELVCRASDGEVLVATTSRGVVAAALSIADGLLVSDPRHRTDELVRLLHVRRHQIARAERPRWLLAVLRPRHS